MSHVERSSNFGCGGAGAGAGAAEVAGGGLAVGGVAATSPLEALPHPDSASDRHAAMLTTSARSSILDMPIASFNLS
jgi:hypothetical protein